MIEFRGKRGIPNFLQLFHDFPVFVLVPMPLQSVGKGEDDGEDANKDHDGDNKKVKVADSEQQLHEPVVLGVLL